MKVLSAAAGVGQVALSDTAKASRVWHSWTGGGSGTSHRALFRVPTLPVHSKTEMVYF